AAPPSATVIMETGPPSGCQAFMITDLGATTRRDVRKASFLGKNAQQGVLPDTGRGLARRPRGGLKGQVRAARAAMAEPRAPAMSRSGTTAKTADARCSARRVVDSATSFRYQSRKDGAASTT